jgi:hypothetical protein
MNTEYFNDTLPSRGGLAPDALYREGFPELEELPS